MKHSLLISLFGLHLLLSRPGHGFHKTDFLNRRSELVLTTTEHRNAHGGLRAFPATQNGENLLEHAGPDEPAREVEGDVAGLVAKTRL